MADVSPETVASEHRAKTKRGSSLRRIVRYFIRNPKKLLLALVVVGVLFLTYGYLHTRSELKRLSNPATAGQNEAQKIITKVSRTLQLPTGETPTLATVNDAAKLKGQQFFTRAQNGDKVLIYSKSGRALLYRPSTNKVIEYAPVSLGANQPQ